MLIKLILEAPPPSQKSINTFENYQIISLSRVFKEILSIDILYSYDKFVRLYLLCSMAHILINLLIVPFCVYCKEATEPVDPKCFVPGK